LGADYVGFYSFIVPTLRRVNSSHNAPALFAGETQRWSVGTIAKN
jgi:hypothetical protein